MRWGVVSWWPGGEVTGLLHVDTSSWRPDGMQPGRGKVTRHLETTSRRRPAETRSVYSGHFRRNFNSGKRALYTCASFPHRHTCSLSPCPISPARMTDTAPPHWPATVSYTPRSLISRTFPPSQLRYINIRATPTSTLRSLAPLPICPHPKDTVRIKQITDSKHPACGQNGLFVVRAVKPRTKVIDYVGVIHSRTPPREQAGEGWIDPHEQSDYDLSLIRCMSTPDPGTTDHVPALVDIGIDADKFGNAARMINDYRGIAGKPNVEFRQTWDEATGWAKMEVWALSEGLKKGDEVLISYGKGFWTARNG